MCQICKMIDKSLPNPKQLAKAYTEIVDSTPEEHLLELEQNIVRKMRLEGMVAEDVKEFQNEFIDEFERLMRLH